ncbi:uncharacterized protein LOC122506146 [Leptopilina heterotoma]|uniref:uncharacterized protein LOC122506146 n=1 Tax=Leptopilina heterotoma TaxID=63436 RepID=UPI001CA85F0E|nr:uncharacterized protein LOC122506146 [Leptopilina heterotoma]
MDALHLSNALSTVQVIPIFNYLTILSDFLFLGDYLSEVDQYKPIPVVNGLYRYFTENRSNQNKTIRLIRKLIQGSDLYGEQENEEPDEIFVTTLFDHIISSLVFAKYGNIYGFLADTIRRAEDLKFDSILERIEENLQNAKFENEYGTSSKLSPLSVYRIFRDMILPLFPQPLYNINVLSLDYLYSLAGSAYLRLGRLNSTYYSNFKQFNSSQSINRILFEEYLSIGYIVEKLYYEKIDLIALKVFALPALIHYTFTDVNSKSEKITNIIFNPKHLERAYNVFFEYLKFAYNTIDNQLQTDYTYRIHRAFSNFISRAKYAKLVLDYSCRFLNSPYRESRIPVYLEFVEHFECRMGDVLPNINDWFMEEIDAFGELYEKYDYEMMQQLFNNSLTDDVSNIVIKLVITNDKVINEDFDTSQHFSYDLLEFHNSITNIIEYYAIVRENYTATLIRESDDPKHFQTIVGPLKDNYLQSSERILLKFINDSIENLCQKLTNYKKERFMSYLNYSDNSQEKSKWWKEFGFSFVPLYPCLSDINHYSEVGKKLCEEENIKFLNKHPEIISTDLISKNTLKILNSFNTNVESLFLRDTLHSHVGALKVSSSKTTIEYQLSKHNFFERLSLFMETPKYESLWFTEDEIKFIIKIINYSEAEIKKTFKYVKYALYKLLILKRIYIISADDKSKGNESVFIRSWNGLTGYGYKFTIANEATNETAIAPLIIGYEFKEDQEDLLPLRNSSINKKTFIKFKNNLVKCNADDLLCKITYRPRNITTISFQSIWNYVHNDDKCNNEHYLEERRKSKVCLRHKTLIQKIENDTTILNEVLKNTTNRNSTLENEIRKMLKMYTFPNKTSSIYFLTNWLKDKQFVNSDWNKDNVADNTGLLNYLLTGISMDKRYITNSEAEYRISSIYNYRERSKIEGERPLKEIVKDYELQKAEYSVTFEDYYAIRNYATTGYRRIHRDTPEAKLMKLALYKLALRQSNDFDEEYDMKLYGFDSIPTNIFKKQFIKDNSVTMDLGKNVTLQKFLLTMAHEESALQFARPPLDGFRNVLFEVKFFSSYLRAKIDVLVKSTRTIREKRMIILPGNKFFVERIILVISGKVGIYFKVVLTSTSNDHSKFELCKNVMREIARITNLN